MLFHAYIIASFSILLFAEGVTVSRIRLVSNSGTSTSGGGRLEVYYNGQWGTVCDHGFGANEARAACRQLGYNSYSRYGNAISLGYRSASFSTPIWLDELSCSSTATSLNQCSAQSYGVHDCDHSEDVAIICTGVRSTSTSIRLVSHSGSTSPALTFGRLEVYYNGRWGTVCDDNFGASEARTACRELGFTSYITYGQATSLGFSSASSSTPIWLDNLDCSSSATRLSQCSHRGYGLHNCVHSEDVAVSCYSSGARGTGNKYLDASIIVIALGVLMSAW